MDCHKIIIKEKNWDRKNEEIVHLKRSTEKPNLKNEQTEITSLLFVLVKLKIVAITRVLVLLEGKTNMKTQQH